MFTVQRKQRLLVRSTILLLKAVVALKELDHDTQDKTPREIKRKLRNVSSLLHKSIRVNITMFAEIQRKRKGDVCQSSGKKIKLYEQSVSCQDYLFDENTMKRINQDIKTNHDKSRSRNFYQP